MVEVFNIIIRRIVCNSYAKTRFLGYAIDASPEQSQCLITRLAYVYSPILLLGWLLNCEPGQYEPNTDILTVCFFHYSIVYPNRRRFTRI